MLVVALCGMALDVDAELTVVFDNGQAKPVSIFLGPIATADRKARAESPTPESLGAADIQALLPVRSPGLTPGTVETRAYPISFARPFFLVGSDERSKRWLEQHRDLLKKLGAVGLLVEASTVEDLQAIAEIADGLPITPASGSDIARALGIAHYPFAISDQRLWQ
jgi:integrating conjugative element protein (TIGR03765 family)